MLWTQKKRCDRPYLLCCLQSMYIHPLTTNTHPHIDTYIDTAMAGAAELRYIQAHLCLLAFDPIAFQRNAALRRNAATGGQTGSQRMGTWTSSHPHRARTQKPHAPHIYSIDFLSCNSFQLESLWSTSMAKRWWKGPFTATLSTEFSGLSDNDPERGQWKAITGSTIEKFHFMWDFPVTLCFLVTKPPSLAHMCSFSNFFTCET